MVPKDIIEKSRKEMKDSYIFGEEVGNMPKEKLIACLYWALKMPQPSKTLVKWRILK